MDYLFEHRRINITDDYMFSYVMRQPGVCKKVIECLLPELHIKEVHFKDEKYDAEQEERLAAAARKVNQIYEAQFANLSASTQKTNQASAAQGEGLFASTQQANQASTEQGAGLFASTQKANQAGAAQGEKLSASTQKTIQGSLGSHSVRLDVYLDDGKSIYNVEMQTGNKKNLPKRVRYYGGRIDCEQLEKSQDYNELRPTYVIFICTFDPFGQDRVHYSFENRCKEVDGLRLGDESYKVFFNATGHKGEITNELRALMDYFMDPENMPEGEKTQLVEELDDFVDYANRDADWRREHMTLNQSWMDARHEGKAEGKIEGIRETIKRSVENMRNLHIVDEEIARLLGVSLADVKAVPAT